MRYLFHQQFFLYCVFTGSVPTTQEIQMKMSMLSDLQKSLRVIGIHFVCMKARNITPLQSRIGQATFAAGQTSQTHRCY